MSKGLFITATGTDIGKTYVTGLLLKKMRLGGYDAGYYKAALSGAEPAGGTLVPGDAKFAADTAGLSDSYEEMVSYVYKNAVSPHLASRIEGNPVDLAKVRAGFKKMCAKHEYVTVEGSGGIVCPIRYDDGTHIFLEDIIKTLELPSVIIADGGLGTINAAVLTYEYMKNRGLPVKGFILNNYDENSVMHRDNKKMIGEITGVPVVSVVKHGSGDVGTDAGALAALFDEVTL